MAVKLSKLRSEVSPRLRLIDEINAGISDCATEASLKLPPQLRNSLRCAPHLYVFSDMAQKLGDVQVHDALDTIPSSVKDNNPDFDLYRAQLALQSTPEKIPETLSGFVHPGNKDDNAAWVLDKYKFNHIVEKTWQMKPDMDWYFNIDADTYVFLSSLAVWLALLDPLKEALIGNVALIIGKEFAHGGSGILMSRAATRSFVVDHNGTAARWDAEMRNNCCGDWVLAQIFNGYGVQLKPASPMLYGEALGSIGFEGGNWCQPVASLHHVEKGEADRIGAFEGRRVDRDAAVTYAEIFDGLILESIPSESRADWDNSSEDETVKDIDSMESCVSACEKNDKCLQLRFNGNECMLGTKKVKLGEVDKPKKEDGKDEKKWQSGWNRTRIAEWASGQKPCTKLVFPI
ncbi:hypothetical protein M7I_4856 [Glarea lozoyensis 74030]|uniref:Uncharacterized protein n=1 Tax=Glarea lozoyensis (strain ATCC 74030 / MF5533) TaxID=1104152 RepID=H0EQA9_GLAL7|nr:hypothetical protein M7I_4856 [Glarea lozoyensis 74030]